MGYGDADEEYHRRETIADVAAAAAARHRCKTSVAAAAAAAAACHRRETSVTAAAAAAACHRRETSVAAAAAAAAAACYRREVSYRRPFVGLRLPRPSVPKTTADDKSMQVRRFRRHSRRRPLFRNSVGLPSGVGGTDGVF